MSTIYKRNYPTKIRHSRFLTPISTRLRSLAAENIGDKQRRPVAWLEDLRHHSLLPTFRRAFALGQLAGYGLHIEAESVALRV